MHLSQRKRFDSTKVSAWRIAKMAGAQHALDAVFGRYPIILMYHRFSAKPRERCVSHAVFESQMQYLARHCHVVGWSELIRGLRERINWAPRTVAITIDDGYSDLYDVAFPVLKKYGLPATAFVTSEFANGSFWFWSDQIRFILSECKRRELCVDTRRGMLHLQVESEWQREVSWARVADACYESSPVECSALIENLACAAEVSVPSVPPTEYRAATWHQLRAMLGSGITIGSHTLTHARLTRCNDAQLNAEVHGSKAALERELQVPITAFAYPFGMASDHDERVAQVVRDAGFDNACVAYFDGTLNEDLYALRRFGVGEATWDFLKTVDGLKRARARQKSMLGAATE